MTRILLILQCVSVVSDGLLRILPRESSKLIRRDPLGIGIGIHPFLHTLHNIASSLPLPNILLVQPLMHIRCIPFALTYIGTDIRLESILFVDFLSDNFSHL